MTEREEKLWEARPRLYAVVGQYMINLSNRTGISPQALVNLALIYAMQHQQGWLPEIPNPELTEVSK